MRLPNDRNASNGANNSERFPPVIQSAQHPSYMSTNPPLARPQRRTGGMRLNAGMRDVHAVYFGGNITRNDWRRTLVQGLGLVGVAPTPPIPSSSLWPHLPASVLGRFDYVGPYSISGDPTDDAEWNNESDDEGSEWVATGPLFAPQRGPRISPASNVATQTETTSPQEVWWPLVRAARQVQRLVLEAIRDADLYFAWVDTPLCAATQTEAGWAAARGKIVWIAGPQAFDEMWLLYTLASQYSFRYRTPAEAFRNMLQLAVSGDI